MKVLLISANTEKMNIIPMPLGVHYVAAATQKKGHDVRVLDLMTHEEVTASIEETIASFHPDVIGISVRNIDDQHRDHPKFLLEEVRTTILHCRRHSNAPIILGGAGYSIFPEAALTYLDADMGIQGEGEYAFPMLVERLENSADVAGLPGLYVKGCGLQGARMFLHDLQIGDIHPFSFAYDRNLWVPFQTRRGCPMDCSYCSTATIEGCTIRKRPLESAIAELEGFVRQGFRHFFFVDNTFNLPPSYAKEFCRLIVRHDLDITWRCILYPALVDEELIELMADAGCHEVSLGFESGCERILEAMNKRFGLEEIRTTSHLLEKHGVQQMGFLMLGGPGETKESVLESLAFADSLPLDDLKITRGIRIYPGTKLARTAVNEGLISPEDDLLYPTFYLVPDIEEWLRETVSIWASSRPHWLV